MRLMPAEAHLVEVAGSTHDVPVTQLKRGDRVLVKPGEKVPTDGTVVAGQTSVNEANVDGREQASNPSSSMVAGAGFEPATFGL